MYVDLIAVAETMETKQHDTIQQNEVPEMLQIISDCSAYSYLFPGPH